LINAADGAGVEDLHGGSSRRISKDDVRRLAPELRDPASDGHMRVNGGKLFVNWHIDVLSPVRQTAFWTWPATSEGDPLR